MTETDVTSAPMPYAAKSYNLSLVETASIIAPLVRARGESLRTTIDKVRKRIGRAVKSGRLKVAGERGAYRYSLPEVTEWARRKWPGRFLHLTAQHAGVLQSNVVLSDMACHYWYPSSKAASRKHIADLTRKVRLFTSELEEARALIDRLIPLAVKYQEISEKNRLSAKLPRKPR